MYTFLNNWYAWLTDRGIVYTDDPDDQFDVLFVNSWAVSESLVKRIKKKQPLIRVVQRVDGSGRDYGRSDWVDMRQARVNLWADLTIFQSNYSKYSTTRKYKVISQDGPVIYNPVNINLFYPIPLQEKPLRFTVCAVSHSTNVKKGTWQIGELASQNPDLEFVLIGNYVGLPHLPNIHHKGHLTREKLADAIRRSHVFVHLAENDSCPNVVIEALSSGLPVLYMDSGGTPELVGNSGLPIEVTSFRNQLVEIRGRYEQYSRKARQRAVNNFAADIIFPKYMTAMKQAQCKPLPTVADTWRLFRQGYLILPRQPDHALWAAKQLLIKLKRRAVFSRGWG